MTAEDLITRKEWEDIVHSVVNGECKEFSRTIKGKNGNRYSFEIISRNQIEIYKKWGDVGGNFDFKYRCERLYDGWSEGGGTMHVKVTESDTNYDELCERINKYLELGGDYEEPPKEEYKQLSLF